MPKNLTVKARKGNGPIVAQTLKSEDQKQRWIQLLKKNNYRVITGKGL